MDKATVYIRIYVDILKPLCLKLDYATEAICTTRVLYLFDIGPFRIFYI